VQAVVLALDRQLSDFTAFFGRQLGLTYIEWPNVYLSEGAFANLI